MAAGEKQGRRRFLVIIGLFIFLTDVQLLNAATLIGNGTNSSQEQTQAENNTGITSLIKDGSHRIQRAIKTSNPLRKLIFGNPISKLAGGAVNVLDNFNPFKSKSPDPAPSTIKSSKAVLATAQKSTTPIQRDPVGEMLAGAGNMFDTALGKKSPTTALAKTTIAPPPGGHGRGVPAVIFNIGNMIQKILEITGALLHWFDHSEPSYLITRIKSLLQSLDALKEVYLQRDMDGGIGLIPKHVEAVLKNIKDLGDVVKNNKNLNVMKLLGDGQSLFKNINKLKDDFIEPVSTTPIPGGLIGNVLHGIGGIGKLINPHTNSKLTNKTNHRSLQNVSGEFGTVVRSAGKLVNTLGDIEEDIQSRDPKNNLLQFVGKIKDLAQLCLTNDTLDDENILDVLQKVWFPNTTLAQMVANFGKMLQHHFKKNGALQSLGILLQQKFLVDLGLNICVRSSDFLHFGNMKYYLLNAFGNVENQIVGNDLNRLLAGGVDILDTMADTFERLLKTFRALADPLFSFIKHLKVF